VEYKREVRQAVFAFNRHWQTVIRISIILS